MWEKARKKKETKKTLEFLTNLKAEETEGEKQEA